MKKFTSLLMLLVMISLQLSSKTIATTLDVDSFCATENEIIPLPAMTNDLKELPGVFGITEGARGSLFTADVGVQAILDPNSGINLDSSIVVIQIKNYGAETQSGIPWEVNWSGVGTGNFSGTYANILHPGGIATFYVGMANLIMYGEYYFEACTSLAGDQNPENDCATKTVINIFQGVPMINLYIYGCLWGDQFTSWNLANIDIPSIPCEGTPPWYQNFANHIHEFTAGQTYALTVTVGFADTYFDIWIDFDNNRDLNDNDELIFDNGFCPLPDTTYIFYITIPENAPNGLFHMRARTNWMNPINPPNGPYNTYEYGICCDFRAKISGGMVFPLNPPENLQATCLNSFQVLLTWEAPSEPGDWLQWCSDLNNDGIGLTNGGTFVIAARWDPADLAPYGNLPLKRVAFFPRSNANAAFTMKIFKGSNASTLLLNMPLTNLNQDEWNVIVLPNPVLIDPDVDLWVGFEITHLMDDFPAGADAGPAVVGKGDMVSLDGTTWAPLSSYGLDYNWNIKAFVAEELDPSMSLAQPIVDLSGGFVGNASAELARGNLPKIKTNTFRSFIKPDSYKIYRNNSLIASGITGLSFVNNINPYTYYTYYIKAVYPWGNESVPSNEYTIYCGWTGQAAINFNPEQIFEMHIEQNMVTTQILNVSNTGSAPLQFMITIQEPEFKDNQQNQFQCDGNANNNSVESLFYPKSDWLSVTPTAGTILPSQTMPVEVTFNSTGLPVGVHNASLLFASNDIGSPHVVPVTLTVEYDCPFPPPTNVTAQYASINPLNVLLNWEAPNSSSNINKSDNDITNVLEGYYIMRNGINIYQIGLETSFLDLNPPPGTLVYKIGARYTLCTSWSDPADPLSLGVSEIDNFPDAIFIFPNPADHIVNIEAEGIQQIRIINNLGRVVFRGVFDNNKVQINVEDFSNGIYLAYVTTSRNNFVKKLIIR